MQRALQRQTQNWEAMLFGLREAQTYLTNRDRRLIAYGRWIGLFVAQLGTALFLLLTVGLIAGLLSIAVLPGLLSLISSSQPKVSEWLSIISLLWTILFAVPVPIVLRAAYQFTRGAQKWLDDWFTVYFITRRTYVPWDTYMEKQESPQASN